MCWVTWCVSSTPFFRRSEKRTLFCVKDKEKSWSSWSIIREATLAGQGWSTHEWPFKECTAQLTSCIDANLQEIHWPLQMVSRTCQWLTFSRLLPSSSSVQPTQFALLCFPLFRLLFARLYPVDWIPKSWQHFKESALALRYSLQGHFSF